MAEKTIARWYAVYVKSRYEKKTCKLLEDRHIEVYLPLLNRLKQWSDRKKMVEEPLFKSYIFVRTDLKNYYDILNTPGVVRFVGFEGRPAPVPDNQIMAVRQFVGDYDGVLELDEIQSLHEGQLVEIVYGEMKGLVGRLVSFNGKQRLIVDIESVGRSIPINISRSQVRSLQNGL
ncbi:MAG: UpxY family transcription antiterminator [Bacteroidales bacterium]|nr:UpxY family transcription antiterminator [Bacteroidales bacterium]